jgi:hypothetical protein
MPFSGLKSITFTELKAGLSTLGKDNVEVVKTHTTKVKLVVTYRDANLIMSEITDKFIEYEMEVINAYHVIISGFDIQVKMRANQRKKIVRHLKNEDNFVEYINDAIKDNFGSLTIVLKSNQKVFTLPDITKAKHVGSTGTLGTGKKADAILIDTDGVEYPISLKQDNAGSWASADSSMKEIAEKFYVYGLDKYLTRVEAHKEKKGVYTLIQPIGFKLNERVAKPMIFGKDILPKGAIVVRTWSPADFELDPIKEVLTIKCSHIYRNFEDLDEEHRAYLILRNDSTRKVASRILPPGIRFEVVSGAGGKLRGVQLLQYKAA